MSEHTILSKAPIKVAAANAFAGLLVQLQKSGAKRVTLAINSPGGQVVSGISMYNTLRAMPFEVITHNIGNVDSISNVVFLGGHKRYMCAASTFMFHGVGFDCATNQRLEEKSLRTMLDAVLADQKRMSGIIAERTKLSVDECMELFREQTIRDAAWAQEKGFVDGVSAFALPADNGSNVHVFAADN